MKTALFALCLALFTASSAHAAPPVIDGNLADFIVFGEALNQSGTGYYAAFVDKPDLNGLPTPENIYSDTKFIPCLQPQPALATHWANGTEISYHYLAYVPGTNHLYIGLTTEGAIGDVDGNDDPDQAGGGSCNPQDNIEDANGIGAEQFYQFRFDLNCDGSADAILTVEDNQLVGTGLFAGATGTFAYRKNAAVGATGHDLEIDLVLPSALPPAFTYQDVLTNAFDGLTEDRSSGTTFFQSSEIDLAASAAPKLLCPGDKARVSLVVSNTGQATVSVALTDQLPAAFGYAGNLATDCGTGEPAINGSLLTFPQFSLAAGATCHVAFDVQSDATCNGSSANVADVVADYRNPCAPDGGSTTIDHAEAQLTCDPAVCAPEGTCRLTGGGCMNDDPDTGNKGKKQNTFGGNSSPLHDGGGPSGNSWEHVYRDGREIKFNWHSWDAHVTGCSVVPPGPCSPKAINTRADFVGTGKYSVGSGGREEDGNQVAYVIDHKEGNCNKDTRDEYSIVVRKGLVIGEGDVVFQATGFIDCGNLQIHETPKKLFGNGVSLPGTGSSGVALLDRAYPNPFSSRTAFAYRVAAGGASVDVGVYDVAGRLVKSLAGGSQAAGTYTVTWDGTDASGVRMAPGVYFLKSRVGGEQVVNRLIYVAR
jgi:hypothetical protein